MSQHIVSRPASDTGSAIPAGIIVVSYVLALGLNMLWPQKQRQADEYKNNIASAIQKANEDLRALPADTQIAFVKARMAHVDCRDPLTDAGKATQYDESPKGDQVRNRLAEKIARSECWTSLNQ